MAKIVTCCVCGCKRPLGEAVAVGYSVAGWPARVPETLYACKDGTCRAEDAKTHRPELTQPALLSQGRRA